MTEELLINCVGAAILTFGFAVAVNMPRRCIVFAILTGAAGQVASTIAQQSGVGDEVAAFLGAFIVGLFAAIGARWFHTPVTVFTITGFISLVPGTLAFRSVNELLNGQFIDGVVFGLRTLLIGGAIAAGLGVITVINNFLRGRMRF